MVSRRGFNWSHMCVCGINHAFYLVPYIFPLTHFKFLFLRVQIYFTINSETIQLIVQRWFLLVPSRKAKNIVEKMDKSFFHLLDFHHNIDAYCELTPGFNCSQCSLVLCTHTILRHHLRHTFHVWKTLLPQFPTQYTNFLQIFQKLADTPCTQNHYNGQKSFCITMKKRSIIFWKSLYLEISPHFLHL